MLWNRGRRMASYSPAQRPQPSGVQAGPAPSGAIAQPGRSAEAVAIAKSDRTRRPVSRHAGQEADSLDRLTGRMTSKVVRQPEQRYS